MSKIQSPSEIESNEEDWFIRPEIGTGLTAGAGLAFLFVCMILPLVGKAGTVTVHARENQLAFLAAAAITLLLSACATISKLRRRVVDQSPLPYFSLILGGLSALLILAQVTGLLRI